VIPLTSIHPQSNSIAQPTPTAQLKVHWKKGGHSKVCVPAATEPSTAAAAVAGVASAAGGAAAASVPTKREITLNKATLNHIARTRAPSWKLKPSGSRQAQHELRTTISEVRQRYEKKRTETLIEERKKIEIEMAAAEKELKEACNAPVPQVCELARVCLSFNV
jgi:hypothetical protein